MRTGSAVNTRIIKKDTHIIVTKLYNRPICIIGDLGYTLITRCMAGIYYSSMACRKYSHIFNRHI